VFVNQFMDRTKKSAEHTFFGRGIVAHVAFAHPVCEELRQTLMRSARAAKARIHDGGTYVNMEGPAFSTQAESIANHRAGHGATVRGWKWPWPTGRRAGRLLRDDLIEPSRRNGSRAVGHAHRRSGAGQRLEKGPIAIE
jgi:hypothetical protein